MAAKLDINGTVGESKAGSNSPVAVAVSRAAGRQPAPRSTAVRTRARSSSRRPCSAGAPARRRSPLGAPSVLERSGAWSLFRLLDAAAPRAQGDWIVATFIVGGTELQYRFSVGSVQNPLTSPALREFRCPTGI